MDSTLRNRDIMCNLSIFQHSLNYLNLFLLLTCIIIELKDLKFNWVPCFVSHNLFVRSIKITNLVMTKFAIVILCINS